MSLGRLLLVISLLCFKLVTAWNMLPRSFSRSVSGFRFSTQHRTIRPSTQLASMIEEEIVLNLPTPVKIAVSVHRDIQSHLNLLHSERRCKLNLAKRLTAKQLQVSYVRSMIEKKLPKLISLPYLLRYQIPDSMPTYQRLADEDMKDVLAEIASTNKTLHLFVDPSPAADFPPLQGEQTFLRAMPDPEESDRFTIFSFYRFHKLDDPKAIADKLEAIWSKFHVLGRVYVATEGINAQMAIPTNVFEYFREVTYREFPFLDGVTLNVDHYLPREDYMKTKPFKALHIRVRNQIVADGCDEENQHFQIEEWNKAGREMPPLEWHEQLSNPDAIILDCRNNYEFDVGTFDNAIPLQTTFFRESWDALDEILANTPKDAPIMTFCTGGIRCVKINAYLEQVRGFTNTSRLEGGIINYTRQLTKATANATDELSALSSSHRDRHIETSRFRGTNYVFDERMGAKITNEVRTVCETCGETPTDVFTNCNNYVCHVRFIQCAKCRDRYDGCCSKSCKVHYHELLEQTEIEKELSRLKEFRTNSKLKNSNVLSRAARKRLHSASTSPSPSPPGSPIPTSVAEENTYKYHTANADGFLEAVNSYCEKYSSPESAILQEIRKETEVKYGGVARMLSGPLQAQLLSAMTTFTRAKAVLELGSFTGYSTIALADGLSSSDGKVYSCELDESTAKIAQGYFEKYGYTSKIEHHNIPADNMIAYARNNQIKFDLVFVDADKRKYQSYLLELSGKTSSGLTLLQPNAMVVIDNTLWKGLVLGQDEQFAQVAPDPALYGNSARMTKLAAAMHELNSFLLDQKDSFDVILLPIRDGLTLLRYKGK